MAFGVKTNERPGTRCEVRYVRMSATKARAVLDLIRNKSVREAAEILAFTERAAAEVVAKALNSAVSNAITNDGQAPEELFVSACFADEGPTLKRWRPRARGRATRIRKRTCHITLIVSRYSDERLEVLRKADEARTARRGGRGRTARDASETRRRRVAGSRPASAAEDAASQLPANEDAIEDVTDEVDAAAPESSTDDDALTQVELSSADVSEEAVVGDSASTEDDAPTASADSDKPVASDATDAPAEMKDAE